MANSELDRSRLFSQHLTKPIGGSRLAGGGLFQDVPIERLLNNRKYLIAFNDFTSLSDYGEDSDTPIGDWVETDIGTSGGGVTQTPILPGAIVLDAGATTAKGFQTQLNTALIGHSQNAGFLMGNALIGPTANGQSCIWGFGCRVKGDVVANGHMVMGVWGVADATLQTDTTGVPAPAATANVQAFYTTGASLLAYSHKSSSVTKSTVVGTLANATYVDLGIRVTQSAAWVNSAGLNSLHGFTEFFVNGIRVAIHNGYVGTSGTMRPSFGVVNGAGAIDMTVDYFWQFAQIR